jgi:hypothetical protein
MLFAIVRLKRPKMTCPSCKTDNPPHAQYCYCGYQFVPTTIVCRSRILANHYRPEASAGGPSWLTFLGYSKDSLWSCDLFRCESATLRTHWVLVVMDQFTRRIIGFGVHRGIVDGVVLCRMFQRAVRGHGLPKYLSSDHDPLYRFHQWQANLRILEVAEIKTVPYVPISHPFVERLIGCCAQKFMPRPFPTSIHDAVRPGQPCVVLDGLAEVGVDALIGAARDESERGCQALGSCEPGRDCNGPPND